jgi:hypothetical protein
MMCNTAREARTGTWSSANAMASPLGGTRQAGTTFGGLIKRVETSRERERNDRARASAGRVEVLTGKGPISAGMRIGQSQRGRRAAGRRVLLKEWDAVVMRSGSATVGRRVARAWEGEEISVGVAWAEAGAGDEDNARESCLR